VSEEKGGQATASPLGFCIVVLAVAFLLFALPWVTPSEVKALVAARTAKTAIAIVGPSTIDVTSNCDTDLRTVATMLSDAASKPVLDLSTGGQALISSVNLAAVSAENRHVTDVVLPIGESLSDDWTTPPYRQLLIYKAFAPRFPVFRAATSQDFWAGFTAKTRRLERGYRFAGRDYPDYRILAITEFRREKRLQGCPNALTHNPTFTRGYFWWTQVATGENPALIDLIGDLQRQFNQTGRRLHVVLLPVNFAVLQSFDPAWAEAVRGKEQWLAAGLRGQGVSVIDLSEGFAPDEFITQWCACTHLNQKGRWRLASAIAAQMAAPPPGQGRQPSGKPAAAGTEEP